MRIYCSNLTSEYRTGEYRIDTALPEGADTSVYLVAVPYEGFDDKDYTRLLLVSSPNSGYFVRGPQDEDMLPLWKASAHQVLRYQRDQKMLTEGAVTSIKDESGNPIVMDAQYKDKDNMEGLARIMDLQGITETTIVDFYNQKHNITRAEVEQILVDMLVHVAQLMYEKWQREVALEACSSRMEIEDLLGGNLEELSLLVS